MASLALAFIIPANSCILANSCSLLGQPRANMVSSSQRRDQQPDCRKRWYKQRMTRMQPPSTLAPASIRTIGGGMLERIAAIPQMDVKDLRPVIAAARLEENVSSQAVVLEACLRQILQQMNPKSSHHALRPEQVRTLRRLIFGKGDTLLIACTGFGKSLIFHAFSVLTGKITIQITPLTKLGDEQLDNIQKLSGSNPCLVTSESRRKGKALIALV